MNAEQREELRLSLRKQLAQLEAYDATLLHIDKLKVLREQILADQNNNPEDEFRAICTFLQMIESSTNRMKENLSQSQLTDLLMGMVPMIDRMIRSYQSACDEFTVTP